MSTERIKAIASRDNPLLVRLRKLGRDPVAYRKQGELWLEGDHLCRAFLERGGTPLQALITEAAWASELRDVALAAPTVSVLPAALMEGISTLESPSAVGFVVPWSPAAQLLPQQPPSCWIGSRTPAM